MPQQLAQPERPELGYTSLGQYLDANQQSLADAFGQARSDAGQFGSVTDPTAAHELARQLGTESGLAGSGRFGAGPYGEWNAALNWAAHGPGYRGLGDYLSKVEPTPPEVPEPPPAAPKPEPPTIEPGGPDHLKPRKIPKSPADD